MSTEVPTAPAAPSAPQLPETPLSWRLSIGAVVASLTLIAWFFRDTVGSRGQAACGFVCFFGLAALFSTNLRAVSLRTLGWGLALQITLVLFVTQLDAGRCLFERIGEGVKIFLGFSLQGARMIFGPLVDDRKMDAVFGGPGAGYVFAFAGLPTIIFVSAFFTVLYYFGVLQRIVAVVARIMRYLMGTSGAETVSVTANVFMGQTEAPLIVRPYVPRMTRSELFALMVSGLAHISGGLMAVYMGLGADPVAILTTSVMASPCSLYLAKLVIPEIGKPETAGEVQTVTASPHSNAIDAAASGAAEGMKLALNVAAMLIAFIALVALVNALLSVIHPDLSLNSIFARLFAPVAVLMGVTGDDVGRVADLLGNKLVLNEFVAYTKYKEYAPVMSVEARILSTYALTGFANFASIGILLGGIGGMAPERRSEMAAMGWRALLVGFLVTLINASLAALLMKAPEAP